MFLTGGNTETILIPCFSNMKIYTRYCAAAANDFIRLRGVVCFIWLVFLEREGNMCERGVLEIPHYRNYKGSGYKLSAQRFLGLLGWTSVSYDWWMVFKATINQS